METEKSFENLRIWQDARTLVKEVNFHTIKIKGYGFNDQIQRAAISMMNNIAERYESGGDTISRRFKLHPIPTSLKI